MNLAKTSRAHTLVNLDSAMLIIGGYIEILIGIFNMQTVNIIIRQTSRAGMTGCEFDTIWQTIDGEVLLGTF